MRDDNRDKFAGGVGRFQDGRIAERNSLKFGSTADDLKWGEV
jgi:hypothetical protein